MDQESIIKILAGGAMVAKKTSENLPGKTSEYIKETDITKSTLGNNAIDAISALVALGVSRADAQNRVSSILSQDKNSSLNDLLKAALKNETLG